MFKYSTKSEYILAITVSSRRIEGVLVHDSPSEPVILRTFSRKRAGHAAVELDALPMEQDLPGDVSFTSTEDSGLNAGMFLASEFGDLPDADVGVESELRAPSQIAVPCDLEILDIVSECADAGYDNVRIVFVLPTDYLGAEVLSPDAPEAEAQTDASGKQTRKSKKVSKKADPLKKFLASHPALQQQKVTVLPLLSLQGGAESKLALYAQSTEPVTVSIEAIRNRNKMFPNVSALETEVTLLLGAARAALIAEQRYNLVAEVVGNDSEDDSTALGQEEISVLLRVGSEDTLIMFMMGSELVHYESLRSITAFDPAETICSRVLLMHDEFGLGDSDRIMLFADESENRISESLSRVFPESHISLLRDLIPPFEEIRKKPISSETLLAAFGALRMVRDDVWQSVFPLVDFLDPKLRGRKFTLPFSWPVAAMIVLLFTSTLFFVYRYFEQSHAIEMVRYELRHYPNDTISGNAVDLQEKIDSLMMRSAGFAEALDALDSLLVGSDLWSRALERTSVYTKGVSGLWITQWREENSGNLVVTGRSTDRNQIVDFATRANGNIESISFAEIRDVPVYEFRMTMLIKRELPEAAIFLREHAAELMREAQMNEEVAGLTDISSSKSSVKTTLMAVASTDVGR